MKDENLQDLLGYLQSERSFSRAAGTRRARVHRQGTSPSGNTPPKASRFHTTGVFRGRQYTEAFRETGSFHNPIRIVGEPKP